MGQAVRAAYGNSMHPGGLDNVYSQRMVRLGTERNGDLPVHPRLCDSEPDLLDPR